MDGGAIRRVSEALQAVIKVALDDAGLGAGGVYVGPLDDANAASAAAVLFLYRVAVNADLRNREHTVAGATPADPAVVYEGALPLDLHFLLTGGNPRTGGEVLALGTLGHAMRALNDSPSLVGLPVLGETVHVSLESITTEEMSRIWTLFPTANFRTSVCYLASPVWIDPLVDHVSGGPVIDEKYYVGHKERLGVQ